MAEGAGFDFNVKLQSCTFQPSKDEQDNNQNKLTDISAK